MLNSKHLLVSAITLPFHFHLIQRTTMRVQIDFVILLSQFVILCNSTKMDQSLKHPRVGILNKTLPKQKNNERKGYSQKILADSGVVGLEHLTTDDNNTLKLLELTNGTLIVQLVFTPSVVLTACDVSNSKHQIHRLLKRVARKRRNTPQYTKSSHVDPSLRNLTFWISECENVHGKKLDLEEHKGKAKATPGDERAKLGSADVYKDVAGNNGKRVKRGIMNVMYPGKKVCQLYFMNCTPQNNRIH